ncbi:MAG: leucine-rich repeat domain-containing protein, partial [Oscillospiraceae bacterium]|nr:leucine-rich repeat domain-containing protein [Oscillospiraceae bacterium]
MKKKIFAFAAAYCLALTACSPNGSNGITEITTVTETSAEEIRTVYDTSAKEDTAVQNEEFVTIAGEEYSTLITELDLSYPFLTELTSEDIKPIEKLENLTVLNFERNEISDLNSLSGLVNLTDLNLVHNKI